MPPFPDSTCMDIENWLPIEKAPNYEVSDLGRIRPVVDILIGPNPSSASHVSRPAFVSLVPKPPNKTRHYPYVNLRYEETTHEIAVCRAVWRAFRGPLSGGESVEFIDSDVDNAAVANLRVVAPGSRVDRETVMRMRREYGNGVSVTELAERYDVTPLEASKVCTGRSWKHLEVRRRSCMVCGTVIRRNTRGQRRYCGKGCRDVAQNLMRRRREKAAFEVVLAKLADGRLHYPRCKVRPPTVSVDELWPLVPRWTSRRLAREAGISQRTAGRLLARGTKRVHARTAAAIRALHQRLIAEAAEAAG